MTSLQSQATVSQVIIDIRIRITVSRTINKIRIITKYRYQRILSHQVIGSWLESPHLAFERIQQMAGIMEETVLQVDQGLKRVLEFIELEKEHLII